MPGVTKRDVRNDPHVPFAVLTYETVCFHLIDDSRWTFDMV